MQALKTPSIRLTWYAIWLILVVFSQKLEQLCLSNKGLHPVAVVFFLAFSLATLFLMLLRYRHEQRYFVKLHTGLLEGITEFFGLIIFATITIGVFMLLVSYLKAMGHFPSLINRSDYLERGSAAFWFDLLASAFIIAIEQQFVTVGFFFNYFMRRNSLGGAFLGVFLSGLIFGALNFEVWHWINFFIYVSIGWMLATVYLSTQNLRVCMLIAIFIALLKVILI
ncbi:CPBP family glutamic-type intramembrane protease [Bombilactobacillus bombi]|uniref:CPBP family glutamic-type intramembrane protease n=1 Tax=Bombilactobacillus bombi TaxID=1303590 RepID=UPI0015E5D3A8|nr:CPBP family glutamic-type intramembrane protease [Bombilactobacillus bombi]MBA1434225.1 hypothetical protein [Bombilactobacillus bombi]